jgi:hypothetical protein
MRLSKTINGLAIAAAAAAVFATVPMSAYAGDDAGAAKGHCVGANSCKGQSACAGAGHSCAGKNACKGQGFTETSKDECTKAGGKYEEPKAQ